MPRDLLTLARNAASSLGDARPTSVQVVKTTFGHAEALVFDAPGAVNRDGSQPVWVVIMKGHFTYSDGVGPLGRSQPSGDTSAAIYSYGSHGLLDGSVGNLGVTAAALGAPVTVVSW